MSAYLFAWNPTRFSWDNLSESIRKTNEGEKIFISWTCGKNKQIKKGDKVFFIKLGVEPRGIFAFGIVEKGSYENANWLGQKALMADVELIQIFDPEKPIFPINMLKSEPPFSQMHWSTRSSGVRIPSEIAIELEKAFIAPKNKNSIEEIIEEDLKLQKIEEEFFEGIKKEKYTSFYERNLKLRIAAIKLHGTRCMVCDFDFEEKYGAHGLGYIEVHHLRPVSSLTALTSIDPKKDMAVVCSNCHRMLHRKRGKVLSLSELKILIKK